MLHLNINQLQITTHNERALLKLPSLRDHYLLFRCNARGILCSLLNRENELRWEVTGTCRLEPEA